MAVELAAELLEILVCPNCHGGLAVDHDRDELVCTASDCGLAFGVRDGIPVLLIDEARSGKGEPTGSDPAQTQADPTQADPTQADPTQADPTQPGPSQGE